MSQFQHSVGLKGTQERVQQPDSPEAGAIKAAFNALLNAPEKLGKAAMKGLKKAGGWMYKVGKSLGGKLKGLFS